MPDTGGNPPHDNLPRDARGAPIYDDVLWRYQQESNWERLKRKFIESPAPYIGVLAGVGMLVFARRNYRQKRVRATDMYILQFRVLTQATVVGIIGLGGAFEMWRRGRRRREGREGEADHIPPPTTREARRAALAIDLGMKLPASSSAAAPTTPSLPTPGTSPYARRDNKPA